MARAPGYKWAIEWLASNDDCYWLEDTNGCMSVTASLVVDMYDTEESKLRRDLLKAWQAVKSK